MTKGTVESVGRMRALYRRVRTWPGVGRLLRAADFARTAPAREVALKAQIEALTQRVAALEGQTPATLPPAQTFPADPFVARAERRLGVRVADLAPTDRAACRYSYFSEIWGEGYEADLRAQYSAYLPYIPRDLPGRIVDLGCGAGEWVAFLMEQGRSACGVEGEAEEVRRAQARGLDIIHGDLRTFLASGDERFAGITLIEVIEHLSPADIAPLVAAAVRRLAPGGVLLCETINMRHPLALNGFYTDPTHTRPVPDDYLVYLMQWEGLTDVQAVYTNPNPVHVPRPPDLRCSYYNYAIVGVKPLS